VEVGLQVVRLRPTHAHPLEQRVNPLDIRIVSTRRVKRLLWGTVHVSEDWGLVSRGICLFALGRSTFSKMVKGRNRRREAVEEAIERALTRSRGLTSREELIEVLWLAAW
jgi:hypothetical protein